MRRTKTIALALIAGALMAGCASTPARHQETAAQVRAQKRAEKAHKAALLAAESRQQYLADVAPLNNAVETLRKKLTNKGAIRAYNRLADIEQSTSAKMLRQQWPANARGDIRAYATALSVEAGADAVVATDFKYDPSAHSVRDEVYWTNYDGSIGPDLQRDVTDANAATAQAQKCRADLGLPPITG
jgi:hypothetical protein